MAFRSTFITNGTNSNEFIGKSVKDHNIKVVITGEGADELFGGYNIFKETKIRHFWAKDPQSKYRPLLLKKLVSLYYLKLRMPIVIC